MPSNPVLESEDRGHVRILRLNRPERKNALSAELGWAIASAVEEAAREDEVRSTAAGSVGGVSSMFFQDRAAHLGPRPRAAAGAVPREEMP